MGTTILLAATSLTMPARAQNRPDTWQDPETRCTYLKVGETLSLRYRRDGSPDCASVPQVARETGVTRNDLQDLARAIDGLRRDINAVRREQDNLRRELEARR
jgi:hypothetical protein